MLDCGLPLSPSTGEKHHAEYSTFRGFQQVPTEQQRAVPQVLVSAWFVPPTKFFSVQR